MNIVVLVAAHNKCDLSQIDDVYCPIQVGAEGKEHFFSVTDDQGDNISELNPRFCELTALYYAWKNLHSDYVGLVHYRRLFSLKGGDSYSDVLTKEQLEERLRKYRLILPRKRNYFIETLYSHYAHTFDKSHLDAAREIVLEKCPNYLPSFDKALSKTVGYMFNMIVSSREICDSYCSWVFPILFELDKRIDSVNMDDFEKRFIGRIAERLFNVWIVYQLDNGILSKGDILELPYVFIGGEPWSKKIGAFLKAKIFHKKYSESF